MLSLLGPIGRAGRENIIVVVDIHVEPGAVLNGQLDRRVRGKAGMFDRVDPGEDSVANAFVAMGMGGDFQMEHVGFVGDRLHLIETELLPADAVAEREHATGGADLDHLRAIFVKPAHLGAGVGGGCR